MNPKVVEIFKRVRDVHAEVYAELQQVHKDCNECGDIKELADQAYALREIYKYADDIRKEAEQTKRQCERLACFIYVAKNKDGPIRTPFATCTPTIKMMASIPSKRKEPERYHTFMSGLGLPDEIIAADACRVHWPSFVEYYSRLQEEGRPTPPGIDVSKDYAVYSLTIRGQKGVDE
jgi:hypothetical protein